MRTVGADGESEFVAVTGAVVTIGGGKAIVLRAVFLEQAVLGKVGSVTTSGEDDRAVCCLRLAVFLVLDTDDRAALGEEFGDASFEDDLDTVRSRLCKVFKALELGIGDDHSRELGTAAVSAGLGVTTKTSDFGEVEGELVLEPVDGVAGLAGQDLDERIAGEIAGLWKESEKEKE